MYIHSCYTKTYNHLDIEIIVAFYLGPIFLPDPRDGSLYTFGRRQNDKDLTKLPFTVCRFVGMRDGISVRVSVSV